MNSSIETNHAEGDIDEVVFRAFFSNSTNGLFVEVGAARPDYLSISALYRSKGWQILAIEPNPAFCELQRKAGNDVLQYACGDHDEDDVDFTVVDQHGADYLGGQVSFESFSSLGIKAEHAALKQNLDTNTIKVNLRKLDTILSTHAPNVKGIDVLSIDVEGWEIEVLNGLDIQKYRPRVMIVENLFRSTRYVRYLNEKGYRLWRRSYPNDIYIEAKMPPPMGMALSMAVHLISKVQGKIHSLWPRRGK
jgi:FkbM family methyltransferase